MSNRDTDLTVIARQGRLGDKWLVTVSGKQQAVILTVAFEYGTVCESLPWEDIASYVADGDITHLTDTTHQTLKFLVRKCQEEVGEHTSAARRYWPRKVAAVLLANIAR